MRFGKGLVCFRRIDAGHEIRDIECFDFCGAVTQRLALHGSAAGKGLGKERDDDKFTAVVGQRVMFAVGTRQAEIGSRIADIHGQAARCEQPTSQKTGVLGESSSKSHTGPLGNAGAAIAPGNRNHCPPWPRLQILRT